MRLTRVQLRTEDDVVAARQRARLVARALGFDGQDQTRIATAVSEIARNAVNYAGGGHVEFAVEGDTAPQLLVITVADEGRGIAQLHNVLGGQYRSSTGMGLGIVGARRLMDRFDIATSPQGTRVTMTRVFPPGSNFRSGAQLAEVARGLEAQIRAGAAGVMEELRQQNRELVAALGQIEQRQRELTRLNAELFDTNRGVLALYAELDEKAASLRSADELKTRFLSNMSHEFRTPLNSILALTGLLHDRVDGPLTPEQELQVGFIRRSALELLEIVNDLLDLAKVESGKIVIRCAEFAVDELFSTLRGMLRPLLVAPTVNLVFDDASGLPPLLGDEAKLAQILRNFLSNALKFTESGEIRVAAQLVEETPARVRICVSDTGIGIAPEDQERIFDEFTQVESRLQAKVRGTGLGLPLCRRLAQVMHGSVWVESQPGHGSRFYVEVPLRLETSLADPAAPLAPEETVPTTGSLPLLVVEDSPADRLILQGLLSGSPWRMIPADSTTRAREVIEVHQPLAAVLDVELRGEDSWRLLSDIRRDGIACLVVSSHDERRKALALGANAYAMKPAQREWLLRELARAVLAPELHDVLVVDDDAVQRSILRRLLEGLGAQRIAEAADADQGWRQLERAPPALMVLDLRMPGRGGADLLAQVRATSRLRDLPVLVCSSVSPRGLESLAVEGSATSFLSKDRLDLESLAERLLLLIGERRAAARRLPDGRAHEVVT